MTLNRKLGIGISFCFLFSTNHLSAAIFGSPTLFASGSAVGATGPDSITIGNGSVWVSYTNGASSTDYTGTSTVVQYSLTGAQEHTYQIAGSVDGLKIDPSTGLVWALQNQDANSRLTVINPGNNTTASFTYATTSSTQGYDDIVFKNGQIYLSYTNPAANADPVLVTLTNSASPLTVAPLATFGANTTALTDPDSLKLDASGNLVLTSGADGTLNFFSTAGALTKTLTLNDVAGDSFGSLDDSFFPTTSQGILFVTDTGSNNVYEIAASGLTQGSIYAAEGGAINAIGSVDPTTGAFTSVVSGLHSPHGLDFLATPEPNSAYFLLSALAIAVARRWRSRVRSSHGNCGLANSYQKLVSLNPDRSSQG
jgi:hypothetical protein